MVRKQLQFHRFFLVRAHLVHEITDRIVELSPLLAPARFLCIVVLCVSTKISLLNEINVRQQQGLLDELPGFPPCTGECDTTKPNVALLSTLPLTF